MKKHKFLDQAMDVLQTDFGLALAMADMAERYQMLVADMMAEWLDRTEV